MFEQYQDGNERMEDSITFWSGPDLRVTSTADVVTERGSTANVRRSNLRQMHSRKMECVLYTVQFVPVHGH